MTHNKTYRIYHILSKNLTFVGMSMDEWAIALTGTILGMIFLAEHNGLVGLVSLSLSFFGIFFLKRFKKLSEGFSLKSFLYSYGYWPRPSKAYPSFKQEVYGK